MDTRRLGSDGLRVSAIGLGMGSATTHFGERDAEVQVATMRRALDLGVNFLDSSDAYQKGRHERLVGEAIRGRRDEVVVVSKFGNLDLPEGGKGYNGRPEYVSFACERSLRQLGVETIDLYYLHRIDPDVPVEDTVGAMARLVEQGKVRHLGLCEAGVEPLRRAHAVHPIAALQTEYSLWSRNAEIAVLDECKRLGIAFVAFSPLARAFLTGKLTDPRAQFEPGDIRNHFPRFNTENYPRNLELLNGYKAIAQEVGCTMAQLAIAWTLHKGEHIIPIPGTRHLAYAQENFGAIDVVLSGEQVQRLDQLINRRTVYGARYNAQTQPEIDTEQFSD